MDNRTSATWATLPLFDVADQSKANGQSLVEAAITYGFLFVHPSSTCFTKALIEQQFAISKQFFAQPTAEKERFHIGTDNRGWLGMHNERLDPTKDTKEYKEAFNLGEFDADGQPQQSLPEFMLTGKTAKQLTAFEDACFRTCEQITDLIGIGLRVEEGTDWFSRRHGKPGSCIMRMLHYPTLSPDIQVSVETDVRAGAHSDYGSLTLLFQRPGQPGLEIRPPHDDKAWLPVPVFPPDYGDRELPPILVNVGDLMTYWTAGLLRSTVHRVIFPKDTGSSADRYSIAFFCHPKDDARLDPVPSQWVRDHKAKTAVMDDSHANADEKKAITAKEHLMSRLAATYAHRVERQ